MTLDRHDAFRKARPAHHDCRPYAVTGPVVAGDSTEACAPAPSATCSICVGAADCPQNAAPGRGRGVAPGIPLLIGLDVIHGHRTMFPVPLAEAHCSIPTLGSKRRARRPKRRGRRGRDDFRADAGRFARPALGPQRGGAGRGSMARRVHRRGEGARLSGSDLWRSCRFRCCVAKHYCAYGPVTAGREYASVDISERTVREVHLPPFAAAVPRVSRPSCPHSPTSPAIPMTAKQCTVARLAARQARLRWRDRQRLQRHRRADPPRRRGGPGRGRGAGAQSRRGHRHDGRVPIGAACRRARAWAGQHV